jgi:hypothetical protein
MVVTKPGTLGANEGAFILPSSDQPRATAPVRTGSTVAAHDKPDHNNLSPAETRWRSLTGGTATFFKNLSDESSGSLGGLFPEKHVTRVEMVETPSVADYFRDPGNWRRSRKSQCRRRR